MLVVLGVPTWRSCGVKPRTGRGLQILKAKSGFYPLQKSNQWVWLKTCARRCDVDGERAAPAPGAGNTEVIVVRLMEALEKTFRRFVVRFRRTGESEFSGEDDDAAVIEGVGHGRRMAGSKAAVPRDFANPTDDVFTVEDAVDAIGFGRFQWKLSMITGLAWMADAMEMMILSILGAELRCDWLLANWQVALITSVVFFGMMLSSSLWGNFADKWGRKSTLIVSVAWTFYFGLLSAFAPVYNWFLILRGLVGVGMGGVPQSVTLYTEFLPTKSRAKCIMLISIFWAIGSFLEVILAALVMPTLGWRWFLAFSSFPLFVFVLFSFWLPESARFDVLNGKVDKAQATLRRIAADNDVPMPLGTLSSHGCQQDKLGRLQDLFTPELRTTTFLLWIVWLISALSYYGLVLLTTEIFQSGDICERGVHSRPEIDCGLECQVLTRADYIALLWTTLAEFPGIVLTIWVIDIIGRRKVLGAYFFLFAFFVLCLLTCFGRTSMTVLIFVARAIVSGGFQVAYVYTPEVYPTSIRALGLGTCSGLARLGALTTPFIAQVMLASSFHLAISIYAFLAVLAGFASLFLPIETKGRGMQDVVSPSSGQEMEETGGQDGREPGEEPSFPPSPTE
uniref:synaptic vesicle 2-related protein n=2 Tax=Myxine glutinosa TaxID=7769 RepID=UPI00358F2235